MSSMLEQAIIDATALREAAIKSAEQAVVEKYSPEIKEAVEKLMEENDFEENKTIDEQIVEADEKGEGYAFVEMADAETAQKAASQMNEYIYLERKLIVNGAKSAGREEN